MNVSRRTLFKGGALLAGMGLLAGLRPSDQGGNHSAYFRGLSNALDRGHLSGPTLLIDKGTLLDNIDTLTTHIKERFDYRIVAKSLPSIPLLKIIMARSGSNKLMVFHQPFLNQVAESLPNSDVLMGKPMPVVAAENFYRQLGRSGFEPATQLQWLIDTAERAEEYAALARRRSVSMQLNIELDVGLHRGGVAGEEELLAILNVIQAEPLLSFSGMMGYEAHVVKVPGDPIELHAEAMAIYQKRLDEASRALGSEMPAKLTLNAGGSPTYQLYGEGDYPCNELAAGSCLVKPRDFDLATLADHKAAAFIATPVLKVSAQAEIPGVDALGDVMSLWDPNLQQAFFTYGGYWKAVPESPKGLVVNPVYGRSTNQEMLNGSNSVQLKVNDWVFLRPTQSEWVFLQFGDIALLDGAEISERWPVFDA